MLYAVPAWAMVKLSLAQNYTHSYCCLINFNKCEWAVPLIFVLTMRYDTGVVFPNGYRVRAASLSLAST